MEKEDKELQELTEKEIKKLGEISLAANELCRVINWASEDAGYKTEFCPILAYDTHGKIESVHIYDATFGTPAEAFLNKEENEMRIIAIWYELDAERFSCQFRKGCMDYVFDTYCCEKLRELLFVMEGSLMKEENKNEGI